jgi:hypothetical protein
MEYFAEGSRVALWGEGGNGGTFRTISSINWHADCPLQFNHVNGLQLIARAHQLVNEGYKVRSTVLNHALQVLISVVSLQKQGCRNGLVRTQLLLSLRKRSIHHVSWRRPVTQIHHLQCCSGQQASCSPRTKY